MDLEQLTQITRPGFYPRSADAVMRAHDKCLVRVAVLASALLDVMADNPQDGGTWREPIEDLDRALNELEGI